MIDVIHNGQAHGSVADALLANNMDHNALRPYICPKTGRSIVALFNGFDAEGKPKFRKTISNAPATLMKEQWLMMDEAVVRAARPLLRVWGDISSAGLTMTVPNGMAYTVIQHQSMTDAGNAQLSMDGLAKAQRDRTTFDLVNLPLPIVHSDFSFSLRELMVSRNSRMPLDTTMVEQSTRKCVELIEKLTLGTLSSYSYGGGTVYGLTNFPSRITKTITLPTNPAWTPETLVNEVLDGIQSLQDIFFNGPYMVWASPGWTKYLDADYAQTYGGKTLRQRLRDIEDIVMWNKADFLSGFKILIVQRSPDVVQAVTGLRLQTMQWDSEGGMQKNFKVMGIMVPRLKKNSDGNTGICDMTAA